MRLGKYTLTARRTKNLTLLICDEKQSHALVSKFIYFTENTERKPLVITEEIADRYRVKQEIKRANKKGSSPQGLHLLAELVEKDIQKLRPSMLWEEWYRVFAYENIYQIAFNRGLRQERQRRKQRDNIDALTDNDIAGLAQVLDIDINKLNKAVLELTASRKAV